MSLGQFERIEVIGQSNEPKPGGRYMLMTGFTRNFFSETKAREWNEELTGGIIPGHDLQLTADEESVFVPAQTEVELLANNSGFFGVKITSCPGNAALVGRIFVTSARKLHDTTFFVFMVAKS